MTRLCKYNAFHTDFKHVAYEYRHTNTNWMHFANTQNWVLYHLPNDIIYGQVASCKEQWSMERVQGAMHAQKASR
jgi:hypothetical protein